VNQLVFTSERPRSRLAQEYRGLVKAIIQQNPHDKEGVISFLQEMTGSPHVVRPRVDIPAGELESRLSEIRISHGANGDVLYQLALIRERQGRLEEALALLTEAVEGGYRKPGTLLRRAELLLLEGRSEDALADLKDVLDSADATHFDVSRAIRWLRDVKPQALTDVPQWRALKALDFEARLQITDEFLWHRASLPAAELVLRQLAASPDASPEGRGKAANQWAVSLIGLGRFREAMEAINSARPQPLDLEAHGAFNYAMAEWAEIGKPPTDLIQRVIDLHEQGPSDGKTSNYTQCLAIAHWLLGNLDEARRQAARARQQVISHSTPEFSAWRYLMASPNEFLSDLDELLEGIEGKAVVPKFMGGINRTNAVEERRP
jgi:tetratricopeptide (TPR) repeat protein